MLAQGQSPWAQVAPGRRRPAPPRARARARCRARPVRWASSAVVQPEPVPTSSTRSPGRTSSSRSIASTVRGCELVCPWPISIGPSYAARSRSRSGRNHSRGTAANASETRSTIHPSLPRDLRTAPVTAGVGHTLAVIKLEGLFGIVVFALWVFCLVDAIGAQSGRIRNLPKVAWILLILFFPLIGSIAWLVAGRPESTQRSRRSRVPRVRPPRPRGRRRPRAGRRVPPPVARARRGPAQAVRRAEEARGRRHR